jgi:hypothetical protein
MTLTSENGPSEGEDLSPNERCRVRYGGRRTARIGNPGRGSPGDTGRVGPAVQSFPHLSLVISLVPEICHVPVCRLCSSSNGSNRLHLSVVAEIRPGTT